MSAGIEVIIAGLRSAYSSVWATTLGAMDPPGKSGTPSPLSRRSCSGRNQT